MAGRGAIDGLSAWSELNHGASDHVPKQNVMKEKSIHKDGQRPTHKNDLRPLPTEVGM